MPSFLDPIQDKAHSHSSIAPKFSDPAPTVGVGTLSNSGDTTGQGSKLVGNSRARCDDNAKNGLTIFQLIRSKIVGISMWKIITSQWFHTRCWTNSSIGTETGDDAQPPLERRTSASHITLISNPYSNEFLRVPGTRPGIPPQYP